ncbi:MAG: hypothetical protein AAFQ07_16245, partial [Chloroflexota bacterium]
MQTKDPLSNIRVLIIGFGRQGKALARWLPKVGAHVVVNDSRTEEELNLNPRDYPGVRFILGEHPDNVINGHMSAHFGQPACKRLALSPKANDE